MCSGLSTHRAQSLLYFLPPDGGIGDEDVVVPLIDHLIQVQGSLPYPHGYLNVAYRGSREEYESEEPPAPEEPVENVILKGLRLEVARQDGIRLIGARHCSVIGCRVTNVGGVGINLGGVASAHEEVGNPRVVEPSGVSGGVGGGGQNLLYNSPCRECRVYGNDVSHGGSDGIFLYGTGNVAENNHVYNTGLYDKDCACINLWGEENVARRNELHDVPRNAVFLKGIDNVVELNHLHDTMLETCDGGAIRMCQRNLTIRGNTIRHNRIMDTVGYGHPRDGGAYQSPYYCWGVYLDDFTCGTTVYGNIIVQTGRGGVMLHGGSDNMVGNNIVVDAGDYQVEIVPIRDDPMTGNVVERNVLVCDPDGSFPYRCTKWVPGSVAFGRNLVWTRGGPVQVDQGAGGRLFESWEAWQEAGLDEGSVVDDPRFVDAEAGHYGLAQDSPAWELGFEEIPVGEIGCYEGPDRASWPLRTDNLPPREDPVLYVPPPRPVHEDFEREQVGRPPRHGDVSATNKAPVIVTDEQAADGSRQSLKIVDAEGLPSPWQPRIFYAMQYREGMVRFSCDIRLDGARPPSAYIDFRQYSETGGREYFSGPVLFITPEGELRGGGDRHTLTSVPLDRWFRIEVTVGLGDQATGSSEVVVTPEGGEAQRVTLPHAHADFKWLERVVIASLTEHESVFHVDNVRCGPVE
jgi:parallel beta-helix repeat protein